MLNSKFIKINLKNKIIINLIGFMGVFFCLVYFIVVPTIIDIKSMGSEIDAQRIDLEKKYIKGQSLKQLNENLKKIEPKLNLIDQIFINKNRELEFITSLENEAAKNQITQKINLSSGQATENQEFKKSSLQLLTSGGFSSQLSYLTDLESLSYYINIKLLELTPASSNNKRPSSEGSQTADNIPGAINMLINADTYWK